jgi:hypothetical protein
VQRATGFQAEAEMAAEVRMPVLDADRADGAGMDERPGARQRLRCGEVGHRVSVRARGALSSKCRPGQGGFGMWRSLAKGFHSGKFSFQID